jgi:hypothetical protein
VINEMCGIVVMAMAVGRGGCAASSSKA